MSEPRSEVDDPESGLSTGEADTITTRKGDSADSPRSIYADAEHDIPVEAHSISSHKVKDPYSKPFRTDDYWGYTARTIVELRMCALSSSIRNKAQWYTKMQDPAIRQKWREEALSQAMFPESKQEWALTEKMVCKISYRRLYRAMKMS